MRLLRQIQLLLALCGTLPVLGGDSQTTRKDNATSEKSSHPLLPPLPAAQPTDPPLALSLREALEMALGNNLDARIEKVSIRAEQARIRFEFGAFDPVFSLQAARESTRRPENANDLSSTEQTLQRDQITAVENNTNALRSLQGLPPLSTNDRTSGIRNVIFDQQNDRYSASLVQKTPWGMRYGFFAEANRLRNTFSSNLLPVFPEYQTVTQIQVVQPLLKDFGPAAGLVGVRTARLNRKIAYLGWKRQLMSSLQAVAATHSDMLFSSREVQVREDAVAADQKLVRYNQRRLEVGFSQPFDVQQALAQVSLDQEQLLIARNALLERQFALKRLILPQFEANDTRVFLPKPEPLLEMPELDRSLLLQAAFAHRPDFHQSLANADAQDVRLRFARNQLLPQLDLVGTYGLNGLSSSFDDSFNQAFDGHTPAWSVGVTFRVPLGNIQARAQLDQVKALREQAILKIKQTELAVGTDVDTFLNRVRTSLQRVQTAAKTRELNEEALRIGTRRMEEGQVSNFELLAQMRRLYDARSGELGAQAELNRSILQLWLATGTLFEKLGIQVPDDRP
jgi:outer membrane protein